MFVTNMDKIKIRLGEACNNDTVFEFDLENGIIEYDDRITMRVFNTEVKVGDTVTFSRVICGEGGKEVMRLRDNVTVLDVRGDGDFIWVDTEKIPSRILTLKNADYETYEEGNNVYTNITFNEVHTAFPLDLFIAKDEDNIDYGQSLIFRDVEGNTISEHLIYGISNAIGNLSYIENNEIKRAGSLRLFDRNADCLKLLNIETVNIDLANQFDVSESCGVRNYEYIFLTDNSDMRGVVLKNVTIPENTIYCELKYNPYYYYVEKTIGGVKKKVCHLYTDSKWSELSSTIDFENKYVNYGEGKNKTNVAIYRRYWKTCLPLSSDETSNDEGLGNNSIIARYEDSIVDSLPIIDMERIRVKPNCLKLSFIFHFRPRITNDGNNSDVTSGYPYTDRWSVNTSTENANEWNDGLNFNNISNSDNYFKSDLLGYLNFSDNDVYYRKKKLTQTFVRLLYYDSPDPISQKLLYYSTVFLDATKLYSKYIKQLNLSNIERCSEWGNLFSWSGVSNVVFYENGDRLDTQIDITHEFDKTRSSEGFYLYLFNQDLVGVTDEKIIYLKVEFNHAGNGKTISMVTMPQNNEKITMDNIYENLYIPVKIRKIENEYCYEIQNGNLDGDNLRIVLFEPTLSPVGGTNNEGGYGSGELDASSGDNTGGSGNDNGGSAPGGGTSSGGGSGGYGY